MSSSLTADPLGTSPRSTGDSPALELKPARVVFLTNFIPPYWKPTLNALAGRYKNLRILVSTTMEADRTWKVDWEGLDVLLQRTLTLRLNVRNPLGFRERIFVHLPIDTLTQLRRFKPDVVISAEFGFRTLLAVIYRRLNQSSRLILYADLSQHTEKGRGWFRSLIRKFISRNVDHFVVLGESGAQYIQAFGIANDCISRVPYATDVSRFLNQPGSRDGECSHRLLYVGRLVERKGLLPFINALSKWLATNTADRAELVLAGDGPLRKHLEQLSLPAGLRLTFLGDKEYRDMPMIYAQSGIFVFPTLADTWGLVVNEAMAAGLPVLGSVYSQAVEELIQNGWNGWTFRTDCEDEMIQAIETCMTVPNNTLTDMRERARSTAISLTSDAMAAKIEMIVDAVMAEQERV